MKFDGYIENYYGGRWFWPAPSSISTSRELRHAEQVIERSGITPLPIADPEGESFWPGQSQQLYDALPGPKLLVPFTAAEGADLHCEPKANSLRAQRFFDWFDQMIHASAATPTR